MIDITKYLLQVDRPARYLGNELNSVHKEKYISNMCLIFPDIYEVGMSNLGFKILYSIMNKVDDFYLERAFLPAQDFEAIMKQEKIEMFSLESKKTLKEFDVLGFSLSYEMCYTNVLHILNMSNIPFRSKDRGEEFPIILAGGTCTVNPSPIKNFFDVIFIGDGEEAMRDFAELLVKNKNKSKKEKLELISKLEGFYVPEIHGDLTDSNKKIKRVYIKDFNNTEYYDDQLVPYIEVVHDRAAVEIQRGCTRGCRFCQAGIVYRPLRERSFEKNLELIEKMLQKTGYSEVSLLSLSSSDYSNINNLIEALSSNPKYKNLSISLPSLRMNKDSVETALKISGGKRPSFTFAPEAGSQRMRDIINKGVSEEEIIETAIKAAEAGWQNFKFYFMIGLPFETLEDVKGIYDLSCKVAGMCRRAGKKVSITVSVSNFVPKPHTPFQWHKQMDFDEMREKHNLLRDLFSTSKACNVKIHDMKKSQLEGIISRGDEKVGDLIERAWEKGVSYDDYRDNYFTWMDAAKELNIDIYKYIGERNLDEVFPWDILDIGVTKEFLKSEYLKAKEEALTPECRIVCSACGMQKIFGDCMGDKKFK